MCSGGREEQRPVCLLGRPSEKPLFTFRVCKRRIPHFVGRLESVS
jgi:hypothetical protein